MGPGRADGPHRQRRALTGGAAHWGKDNENGARLAVEDLNRKGLVIGGKKVRFELLSEDDQADPRQAMVVANKLVDSGVKAMLGHFNSGAAIPASAIYARAGIPDISVATNPQLTQQGFRNTFRIIASDDDVGAALSRFAVTTLNAKKVAIIDDRTAYGQGAAEVFEKGVKGLGRASSASSSRATRPPTSWPSSPASSARGPMSSSTAAWTPKAG